MNTSLYSITWLIFTTETGVFTARYGLTVQIQDDARNVIPLIAHIHICIVTKAFDNWYRIDPHRLEKLFLLKVCKLSVCKEPTLYQSVSENVSESLLHYLFLHKTIQLSPFDLQSTARCPSFYKLVTSIAFSMNYSIHSHVCKIDTVTLQF